MLFQGRNDKLHVLLHTILIYIRESDTKFGTFLIILIKVKKVLIEVSSAVAFSFCEGFIFNLK